jgi:hypothetical protein
MTPPQRGLAAAVRAGLRTRIGNAARRVGSWLRALAPAALLMRAAVALAYVGAGLLAAPAHWSTGIAYVVVVVVIAGTAAFLPAGPAPLLASLMVAMVWTVSTAVADTHRPGLWSAAMIGVLLYLGHSAAATGQRLRSATRVDAEIIVTWVLHVAPVAGATVVLAGVLSLFNAHFAAIPGGFAVAIGIMSALTVIYFLARSLHKGAARSAELNE